MHVGNQRYTLKAKEVAVLLRTSEHNVGRMAARGEIPGAFRAGRLWRFPTARLYREILGCEPPPTERSEE